MTTQGLTRPTIPAEEYADRWRRVQAMLAEQEIDLLVAYSDDRATFGPAHARWLADFPVHFEPACILVPREGSPVMLVGPESDEYARLRGQIADVRVLRELTHPDEDYPYSVIQGLREILQSVGMETRSLRRAGLAGRGLMGADTLRAFEAALPGVEWLDVETAVCDLRAVKSAAEVAVIREAYRIADLGIEAANGAIRPGVTERAVGRRDRNRPCVGPVPRVPASIPSWPRGPTRGPSWRARRSAPSRSTTWCCSPSRRGTRATTRPSVGSCSWATLGSGSGTPWRGPSVPRRPARACCDRASRVGLWRPRAGGSWRTRVSARPSSIPGCTASGSSSSSHPSSAPAAQPCCSRAWSSPSTSPMFNTDWGGLRVESGYLVTQEGSERLERAPYQIQR